LHLAFEKRTGRALDDYVEAQVHANIDLATDVEAVVVDPSFRGIFASMLLISF
jgi:hypothetical protein